MTNLHFFSGSFCLHFLMVKFGGSGNLLGVLMKDTNFCDDGYIADIHNSTEVWVAYINMQFWKET